jgi:hypothetical protein
MTSLAALYHITPENLALRRQFIGLDGEVVALLATLRPWADEVCETVAEDLTDHHFRFSSTAEFLGEFASAHGMDMATLRAHWKGAQAGHWKAIFAQATQPQPFGVDYFGELLRVGNGHNTIDLPLKWFLGSYPAYLDAVRRALRATPPQAQGTAPKRAGVLGRRHQVVVTTSCWPTPNAPSESCSTTTSRRSPTPSTSTRSPPSAWISPYSRASTAGVTCRTAAPS